MQCRLIRSVYHAFKSNVTKIFRDQQNVEGSWGQYVSKQGRRDNWSDKEMCLQLYALFKHIMSPVNKSRTTRVICTYIATVYSDTLCIFRVQLNTNT